MIVSPLVQLPLKSGVVSLVTLSVSLEPLSVAAVMSGVPEAAGAVVSIVKDRPGLAAEVLPAASPAVTVTVCAPAPRAEVAMLYALPLHVAEPTLLPSTSTVIMSPFVQLPVKVGVVTLVRLSVLLEPLSLPALRSGATPGALGALVSIVIDKPELTAEIFPAVSVLVAVML